MVNAVPLTRAEALAADIEAMIVERGLGPGALIGTMDEFRDRSGYGRATISEAARLLHDRGSVEIRPGRGGGLFVAQPDPIVRLRHTLLTVRRMPATVADAIAVREALEPVIAADAARHRSRQDISDLRKHLTRLKRATTGTDRFMRANWALHERIAEIGPNHLARAVYLSMTRFVTDLSEHAGPDHGRDAGYLRLRLDVHAELVEAIIAGDVARTLTAVERHHASS
ncbi:FCD domain-containing protein [Actinomadura sp. ATCC 31491]|uniref:FCD domain-containing protein n=1 Tax=Actinomadura luzonensis TaxID=2805427 RepID=A0ABT0G181_9ACTN|nr:FCD domain-containing protein [Actinomadura luzonensis]MCK2218359.1 FCD domain-containing protein [Actinomadura luzonensis]